MAGLTLCAMRYREKGKNSSAHEFVQINRFIESNLEKQNRHVKNFAHCQLPYLQIIAFNAAL